MNIYCLLPLLIDFNFTCKQDDPENHLLFDEIPRVPDYGSNNNLCSQNLFTSLSGKMFEIQRISNKWW